MIRHSSQRGFTLIELLIASALGLVLLLALTQIFTDNRRHRTQNQQWAEVQDQGRHALASVSRDLQMAGYWGDLYQGHGLGVDASAGDALPSARDCGPAGSAGWAFAVQRRVEFHSGADEAVPSSRFSCLGTDVVAGSDVVAMRRVSGQALAELETCRNLALSPYDFVLSTNGVVGTLLRVPATGSLNPCSAGAPALAPLRVHRYLNRVYYVRTWSRAPGDGLPALCRRQPGLMPTASFVDECVAEGVEDLQITWGIDTDNDPLNSPDRYLDRPTDAELARAVTARIFLRVRARTPDLQHSDVKTYAYADRVNDDAWTPRQENPDTGAVAPRHYYRQVFSTTVTIRNPLP